MKIEISKQEASLINIAIMREQEMLRKTADETWYEDIRQSIYSKIESLGDIRNKLRNIFERRS